MPGRFYPALLPVLIKSMERHAHLRPDPVLRSSLPDVTAATIDRLPAPRTGSKRRGRRGLRGRQPPDRGPSDCCSYHGRSRAASCSRVRLTAAARDCRGAPEHPMTRGFLYLAAVMDWVNRYMLARRLSNLLDAGFRQHRGPTGSAEPTPLLPHRARIRPPRAFPREVMTRQGGPERNHRQAPGNHGACL
jgi:hypothetical protein